MLSPGEERTLSQPNNRIAQATEDTLRRWRGRRATLLIPSLILFLALMASVASRHLGLVIGLSGGLILGWLFEKGALWRDSRIQASASGNVLFSSTGRFRFDDLGALKAYLGQHTRVRRSAGLRLSK